LKSSLLETLEQLQAIPEERLLELRYERLCAIGNVNDVS